MANLIISGRNDSTGQRQEAASGDLIVDNAGNLILAGGVELVSTTTGIDGKSATVAVGTSAVTISCRAGTAAVGGGVYLNALSGGTRQLGGALSSMMEITEYTP